MAKSLCVHGKPLPGQCAACRRIELKLVERLTNQLHSLIEPDQGLAYCSDGVYASSIKEFFSFTEAQLYYNREASKKMAAFLRKHKSTKDSYG